MINWKLRLKNKATLLAIVTAVIALISTQILRMLGIVPAVSESEVTQAVGTMLIAIPGNGRHCDRSDHTGRIRLQPGVDIRQTGEERRDQ